MEYRIKDVSLSCGSENELKIGGYINVTERESETLYSKKRGKWFNEVMKRGVFQSAINKAKEIPLLVEHNWDNCIATTANRSLELVEDNIGLKFTATIQDKDIYEKVKSGVINSCSFGFRALKEAIEPVSDRLEKRFVSDIELLEVSLVKNPAYVGSLVEQRNLEEAEAQDTQVETVEAVEPVEAVEAVETNEEAEERESVCIAPANVNVNSQGDVTAETSSARSEVDNSHDVPVNASTDNLTVLGDVESKEEAEQEVVKEFVDELIEQKINEIEDAEHIEEIVKEDLEVVQEIHQELQEEMKIEHEIIEESIKAESMRLNAEIVKLRLELIKLQKMKELI